MDMMANKIQALLFTKPEPLTIEDIATALGSSTSDTEQGLEQLSHNLANSGLRLVRKENVVQLVTAPEYSDMLERVLKEELEKDLGKAGLETLTTILYGTPISRAQIDYIRGVNSTYTLRHLLVRGLIEKTPNPRDKRSYLYKPTLDVLRYLGLSKVEELPEYATVQNELKRFFEENDEPTIAE